MIKLVQNFFVNRMVGLKLKLIKEFFSNFCSRVGGFFRDKESRKPLGHSDLKKESMSFPREFYDHADTIISPMERIHRKYTGSIPDGITIHYTGNGSVESTIKALRDQGLNYHLIIDRDGKVYQTASFLYGTHHAGKSIWRGQSPNFSHLSVALVSWGWLMDVHGQYETWAGRLIHPEHIRHTMVNGKLHWHKATDPQQAALMRFLRWCVDCGMDPDRICGHDECCEPQGRKLDPGGILGWPVSSIREKLRGRASRSDIM